MNILKLICFSILCLFPFGCTQKLPTHDAGYGLVALPFNLINRTSIPFIHTYEWTSSTDGRFSIKIERGSQNKNIALSGPIAAGQYTVDTIVVRTAPQANLSSPTGKQVSKLEAPFVIDVYDGKIVLIPLVFEAEQYLEREFIYLNHNVVEFDDEDEAFYSAKLRKREGFSQWRIEILGEGRDITEAKVIEETGDITETFEENRLAAEQGDMDSQFRLGQMYHEGKGVQQDYSEAMKWYRKAADQEYAPAQFSLGLEYNYGKGVPKDCSEAMKWYHKAADQEYVLAQYKLGIEYDGGLCVPQDYAEAAKWYRKAADHGEAEAQYNLGVMYYDGRGVAQDYSEAMKWYRKAADQGYTKAQFNLAVMYYNSRGVLQNNLLSCMWLNIAAANGIEDGVKEQDIVAMLLEVTTNMTSEDISRAQSMARVCIKSNYQNCGL